MYQERTEVETGHDPRKYVVGARLRFTSYNPQELACTYRPEFGDEPPPFVEGDVLRVDPRNGCGMGIDVTRERDGHRDMVWPEEVDLVDA